MAERCRPARRFTSQPQATVAKAANRQGRMTKRGSKPGASRATLAAGCGGKPVSIATQTTQMTMAQPVKKIRVNQSTRAETLRLSVGSAKAASVARAGSANSRARSPARVNSVAPTVMSANQMGRARCRLKCLLSNWRRQRHNVHSISGQAGQVNHNNRLPSPCHAAQPGAGNSMRQRHRPISVDSAATNTATVIRTQRPRI